jgi:hypothetical protein
MQVCGWAGVRQAPGEAPPAGQTEARDDQAYALAFFSR